MAVRERERRERRCVCGAKKGERWVGGRDREVERGHASGIVNLRGLGLGHLRRVDDAGAGGGRGAAGSDEGGGVVAGGGGAAGVGEHLLAL